MKFYIGDLSLTLETKVQAPASQGPCSAAAGLAVGQEGQWVLCRRWSFVLEGLEGDPLPRPSKGDTDAQPRPWRVQGCLFCLS